MKKSLYTHLLSLSILFISFSLSAQFPGGGGFGGKATLKGKIEGSIIDSVSKEAVGFATIALRKPGSSVAIDGVITDDVGNFKLENVVTGKYNIVITFLGYEDKTLSIETTLKNPDLKVGNILLNPSSIVLDAVEVQGERSLIENKVDRLVFNAENDASISGGDATDVLRKVPLLSVDLNGNVSLRGSQNVRILINGKPSGMFSNNVADALKMFPADQIKKVEVITAPSAKYDGEGSAGIINIITQKQNIDGLAGSINMSVGNLQNNAVININAGKGRFGLTSTASVFYSVPVDGANTFLREATNGSSLYRQDGIQNTSRLGANGNFSAFYDINGYNAINSSFNFRGFGFSVDGTTNGLLQIGTFKDQFTRTNTGNTLSGGFDWNTDYTRKFAGKEGKEWVTAFQFSKDNNDQEFVVIERHTQFDSIDRNVKIFNNGDNFEYTLQTDYTLPLANGAKLEVGAKGVFRDIISDFYNDNLVNGQYQRVESASNVFRYNQDVAAGYGSYSFILNKKNNFIIGARYEHTFISGKLDRSDTGFENDYGKVLPSITYSRNLPKFRSWKLSYTQRIQRPSLFFLNPFNNNVDNFNRSTGNPNLKPEIVHQVETSYNATFAGFTTFSSIYYKFTDGIIEAILKLDEEKRSINTFANVGTNKAIGLNTFISKTISKFTMRTGGNLFTYNANGVVNGQSLSRKSYEYNIFMNGDFSFTSTLKADFFGFFRSQQRTLQGDNPAFSIYGIGFRKEWKNSSLGLRLIQPHKANLVFSSNIVGEDFIQRNDFALPFRSIGVNFRYKFGKVDFKERKSKIKNSDLKGNGDTGGQGATTPATN
jgi:hypothetical protein